MPLPNVTAKILSKVMEYCKFHVAAKSKTEEDKPSKTDEEISVWDKDFVKVDQATLFELILVRTGPSQTHALLMPALWQPDAPVLLRTPSRKYVSRVMGVAPLTPDALHKFYNLSEGHEELQENEACS